MKRFFALLLILATMLGLCACGSSQGSEKGRGSAKVTVNISDYVYMSRESDTQWISGFSTNNLVDALIPHLKDPDNRYVMNLYWNAFSVDSNTYEEKDGSAQVPVHVNKALLQGLEQLVDVDFVYDKVVTIPLTGNGKAAGEKTVKIDWADYLVISPQGINGKGELDYYMDVNKFLKDYSKKVELDLFSEPTRRYPSQEAMLIMHSTDLGCYIRSDKEKRLSNGDILTLTLVPRNGSCGNVIFEANKKDMTYKVNGLPEAEPANPFENVVFAMNSVDDHTLSGIKAKAKIDHTWYLLDLQTTHNMETPVQEGEPIHVIFDSPSLNLHMEADIPVTLPTLPNKENAAEALAAIPLTTLGSAEELARLCIRSKEKVTDWEVAGTMLYYNDAGHTVDNRENPHNQLIFVFRYMNDEIPEGWYSCAAVQSDMVIYQDYDWATGQKVPQLLSKHADKFGNTSGRIYNEWNYPVNVPITFQFGGHEYTGHRNLSELVTAIRANFYTIDSYDHLVVSESLRGQIEEY